MCYDSAEHKRAALLGGRGGDSRILKYRVIMAIPDTMNRGSLQGNLRTTLPRSLHHRGPYERRLASPSLRCSPLSFHNQQRKQQRSFPVPEHSKTLCRTSCLPPSPKGISQWPIDRCEASVNHPVVRLQMDDNRFHNSLEHSTMIEHSHYCSLSCIGIGCQCGTLLSNRTSSNNYFDIAPSGNPSFAFNLAPTSSIASFLNENFCTEPEPVIGYMSFPYSPSAPHVSNSLPADAPTSASTGNVFDPWFSSLNDVQCQTHKRSRTYPSLRPKSNPQSEGHTPQVEQSLPTRSLSEGIYRCKNSPECPKRFHQARNRRRHEQYSCTEIPRVEKRQCTQASCTQSFQRPDGLTKHMTVVHTTCTICLEKFASSIHVTDHKLVDHNIPKRTLSGSKTQNAHPSKGAVTSL